MLVRKRVCGRESVRRQFGKRWFGEVLEGLGPHHDEKLKEGAGRDVC